MNGHDEDVERIEITGPLDRPAAEALRLEIHRLAERHGIEIDDFVIEEVEDGAG